MRAYSIVITNPNTGALIRPASLAGANLPATYTSFVNGKTIPGALNVEFDIPVFTYAVPMGGAWVRIWGISLQEISQAQNLVGNNIAVYGGMQKGLPLANPLQAGLLVQGQIYQALGNWETLDQTLDLFIRPSTGTLAEPKNIVLNWPANTPMAQALKATLQVAFPGYQLNINVSPNLVQPRTEVGFWSTLEDFSQWAREASTRILGDQNYLGVAITINGSTIRVYDNGIGAPASSAPKMIAFQDLIGQPTWIDAPTISFKTVMRADISVGDYIKLPNALPVSTPQSLIATPVRNKPTFQGVFQVQVVRHMGNFRQADAASWVTVFDAYPTDAAGLAAAVA